MVNIIFGPIKEQIMATPDNSSGVYKMLGKNNSILYIGKAKDLKSRLTSYLRADELSERIKVMIAQIVKVEIIITNSELDALLLESQLIKSLKPRYNIILRDDKTYPYIVLSDHKYPRISKYRGQVKKGQYYGPFVSVSMVKNTIIALQKAFLLRSCSDSFFTSRKRPCIEYEIKRCSAPCVNNISIEDYTKSVKLAHNTLTGKSKEVQTKLFTMMENASKKMDYEYAAIYRDRLKALQQIQEQTISAPFVHNADIIGAYCDVDVCCIQIISFRNGYNYGNRPYFLNNPIGMQESEIISTFIVQFYKIDVPDKIYINYQINGTEVINLALKKISGHNVKILQVKTQDELRLLNLACNNAQEALKQKLLDRENLMQNLEQFAELFGLRSIPERIEVYDNSHISGEHQYGVMIVTGRDGFLKKEYKKFAIKSLVLGDDYAMMAEVIKRRFSGSIKNIVPDFLLIDGGPGHMSVVAQVLQDLEIKVPFACIAKGPDRNAGREHFYQTGREPFSLEQHSKLLLYLQSIRNEAHRFAITTHRKKRSKSFLSTSQLNEIPNVGSNRKKALLAYFGSIIAIKNAHVDEIKKVPGISKKLAQQIADYLK